MRLSRFSSLVFSSSAVTIALDLIPGRGISNFQQDGERLKVHPVPIPALSGRTQPARDHMNPRSSSQPSESHSRRFPPAMTVLLGWTVARVVHVTAMPSARSAPGLAAEALPGSSNRLNRRRGPWLPFSPSIPSGACSARFSDRGNGRSGRVAPPRGRRAARAGRCPTAG